MTIIELGERFTGQALIAGNAAFSLMWGVGGIVMPPLAGGAMSLFGAAGLPVTLGVICLVLMVASVVALRGGLNSRHRVG